MKSTKLLRKRFAFATSALPVFVAALGIGVAQLTYAAHGGNMSTAKVMICLGLLAVSLSVPSASFAGKCAETKINDSEEFHENLPVISAIGARHGDINRH